MIRLEMDSNVESSDVSPFHPLIQSFRRAAPFETPFPKKPLGEEEGLKPLCREVWLQTRDSLISMLHRNYALGEERLWDKLHIFDSSEFTGHTRYFRVALSAPSVSERDMFKINMALGDFADNFKAASQGIPNVEITEKITPDLLSIAYIGEGLLLATQKMVYSFHPENGEAWAHLQSAMHVLQRIHIGTPAHKLN